MIVAGVKDLKNSLSRYLLSVKKGEDLLITERGKAIARIIPENPPHPSLGRDLLPLIRAGTITLPRHEIERRVAGPLRLPGKRVSEMVVEDRR